MENIFRDVEDAEVYIDDIGTFSNSWEEHMALLCRILSLLQDNGFTVNSLSAMDGPPPLGKHLGIFGGKKHQVFSPAAANKT